MDPEHLRDLFSGLPQLGMRRMFGGLALYSEGLIFAIVGRDHIWIKADGETIPLFEKAGSVAFGYENKGRSVRLPYWSLPDEAIDDADQALKWARLGLQASSRAPRPALRQRKAPSKRPRNG